MTNKNLVNVVMVLDESGSMYGMRSNVISAVNSFISDNKKLEQETYLSIYKFNGSVSNILFNENIKEGEFLLNDKNFSPRGNTALYDALNYAIDKTGDQLSLMNEHDRPGKVIVFIYTDGEDNSSKIDPSVIKEKIKHQEDVYSWEFMFVAAGVDGREYRKSLQISDANFYQVSASAQDLTAVYDVLRSRSSI